MASSPKRSKVWLVYAYKMKMKKILLLLFVMLLLTNCESPGDCIKSTGPIATKTLNGLTFTKILVNKGIAVVIRQGDETKVEIKTGQNLINDIEVGVANGMLILSDNTSCNWTREYGGTVVYVTTPTLTDIYSKTEQNIISEGILTFPALHLFSMDTFDGYSGIGTGDFLLQVQSERLTIDSNNVSRFFLTGTSHDMQVNFYESGGIFHGEHLLVNNIYVYHRGTNDIVLHPLDEIKGDIYNIGNVICVNHPPVVEVRQHYRGQLIFY
jgi:hypothetical protein